MPATNVVLILTDNQAPWSLGCYGNPDIRTPHIDALAGEGVRFDRAHCVNPVCSPNRATALTGLMPSQHGVHSWLGAEKPSAQLGEHAYNTIAEFANLPDILHAAGYDCGLTGKWHLGDSVHPPEAFSYWFTMTQGQTRSFNDTQAVWQGEVYKEPRYFTDVIADHAQAFLREPARQQRPFFLYVPFNGPYGLDHDLHTGHRNRHADHYADKDLPDFPRVPRHPWQKAYLQNNNNVQVMRNYAAAVSGVDDAVGRLMATLDETGLADDTLVVYTSDHGFCGGHHGFWGMSDHSQPRHLHQPNITIPLIARHRAGIAPRQPSQRMVSHYDLLPTLLDYLGLPAIDAAAHHLPGESYAPVLRSEDTSPDDRLIFHEYENVRCVLDGRWKLTRRHPAGPDEMYDLANDPGEWCNLYNDPAHRSERDRLQHCLDDFFAAHSNAKYDLWRNGHSKAGETIRM